MKKLFLVAWHEYRQHVFTKRFLLGLLSVPFLILVMVGLIYLVMSIQMNNTPIGYVDNSGLLTDPLPAPAPEKPEKPVPMLPFSTEEEARAALEAGEIQAYYLLLEDYLSTGELTMVYESDVKASPRYQFYDFLAVNLVQDIDPAVARRLLEGPEVFIRTPDGSRTASSEDFINFILPGLAGIIFMVIMFSTGGYLMQAVVDEKENRTMEVLITSVSPNQFMAGKIIGDISIGLTQILLWGGFIVAVVLVGRGYLPFLRQIEIASQTILLLVVIMLPTFVMVSALMAMAGATVVDAREGQQIAGLLGLPVWIPYMLMFILIENPNSPISILLSLLPMTGPLSMLIRDGFTILPAWQIAVSSLVQVAGAVGAIWLAGRAFRLGMLRYGQRLRLREIVVRRAGGAQ